MTGAMRGRTWSLLPPLIAFALVNAVLLLAATIDGFDYFDPGTWVHWDSFHYLDIADQGVTHFECLRLTLWDPASVGWNVMKLLGFDVPLPDSCGNAGWFPGYPMLIRVVSRMGLSPEGSGVLIAAGAQLATLYALWLWFLRPHRPTSALVSLLAAAFFFGHVYYRAVFPMSVTTLLLLAHIYLIGRDRWIAAGVAGAVAAFFYPTGFLVAPVAILWLVIVRRDLGVRAKVAPALLTGGLTMLGFGAVIVLQWIETGVWGAFFDIQGQFGYGVFPATRRLGEVLAPIQKQGLGLETVPNLQTCLVAVTVVAIIVVAVHRRRELSTTERWIVLGAAAFWLFPLMLGGRASLYRIESLLLPVVILLPKLPGWLQMAVTAAAVALSYPMALLFFRNILI